MAKLTKKFIEHLISGEKERVYWDDTLPNFGVRVRKSGRKTFIVQYRNENGRTRKVTIGPFGRLTIDLARKQARQILSEVDLGNDPAEVRLSVRKGMTVKDMAERYFNEHCKVKKKPRSIKEDRRLLDSIIIPALGNMKLIAVTRADIIKLHQSQKDKSYQANRVASLLSKMFNLAEKWGLRPDASNPCRHIEKFKEEKRNRFLSQEELGQLGVELSRVEEAGEVSPYTVAAIRLLVFTGARLSEVLSLKWEYINPELGIVFLPDSKTGAKSITLNKPTMDIIRSLEPYRIEGNPYLLPGKKEGEHLVNIHKQWRNLKKRAGLGDVRLHDLRHSFASVGASAGLGLNVIGVLLGHTQAQTTARYAHLANDPVKAATENIGQRIKAAMDNGLAKRKIIPFRK